MAPPPNATPVLRFGSFELNAVTGELRKSGISVKLRPQAARVLTLLLTSRGQLITREDLQEQIWGHSTFVDFEHGLNLCIREIRVALDDDADTPHYIETLPRHGYRFIGPVEDLHSVPAMPQGTSAPLIVSRKPFPWLRAAFFAAIPLVLGTLFFADPADWRERLFGGSASPVRTIAVLPLQNLSSDPGQDYFADGITEALTTDLARMENLQVISRTSAMRYKDAKKPLREIAHELNADVIVEGSVLRSGNRVRITAQLIRASSDKHLWAETYERDLRDILALEDEVASTITQQIETRLGGPKTAALPEAHAVSSEAYETYLKANYYLDNSKLSESIDYYNEAIKLDPNFAPSYAHMARAYFFLAFYSVLSPSEGWGKVKELGTLAVEKDDRLPEAHGALALAKLHYDWDFTGAEREFKRALELNPSDADIRHDYAHYLMAMGRMAESEAESRRAVELAPVGGAIIGCLCWHSFAARDYDQSIRLAKNVLASNPNNAWERTILGWDYEQKQMPDEAIVEFKTAVDAKKSQSFYLAALGHAYALAGRGSEARQVLETLIDRSKKSYVSAFEIASIYAGLGDKDAAFMWLNKAADERSTFLIYSKWEPRLDPLRSDPRFQKLLQRIGLS